MANTVTVTTLQDGSKHRAFHVYVAGDGTGEVTNSVIYNYSTDTTAPASAANLAVEYINCSTDALSYSIAWDGATPFQVWGSGNNGLTHGDGVDFVRFGGLRNLSTTPNGNLILTTTGLGAGEHMWLVIIIRKG